MQGLLIPHENARYKKKKTYWNKYKFFIKEEPMILEIIAAPENIKKRKNLLGLKMTNI